VFPSRCLVAFVRETAANGHYGQNPYCFPNSFTSDGPPEGVGFLGRVPSPTPSSSSFHSFERIPEEPAAGSSAPTPAGSSSAPTLAGSSSAPSSSKGWRGKRSGRPEAEKVDAATWTGQTQEEIFKEADERHRLKQSKYTATLQKFRATLNSATMDSFDLTASTEPTGNVK